MLAIQFISVEHSHKNTATYQEKNHSILNFSVHFASTKYTSNQSSSESQKHQHQLSTSIILRKSGFEPKLVILFFFAFLLFLVHRNPFLPQATDKSLVSLKTSSLYHQKILLRI